MTTSLNHWDDPRFYAKILARLDAKAKAKQPKPMARKLNSTEFKQQVDRMVDRGMDRRAAIQQLSEQQGLSNQPVQSAARRYFRR